MNLLERWDMNRIAIMPDEIRRAIAIAQTVQSHADEGNAYATAILEDADKLLADAI